MKTSKRRFQALAVAAMCLGLIAAGASAGFAISNTHSHSGRATARDEANQAREAAKKQTSRILRNELKRGANSAAIRLARQHQREANATPDGMIWVEATNGDSGYVKATDLDGPMPTTPEEAATFSAESRTIPVYAEDGVTVLGSFIVQAPGTPSYGSSSASR